MSESSRRIANVLANTVIKTMSVATSSSSDEEGESSLNRSHNQSSSSSVDTDAHESDNEAKNNHNNNNNKSTTKIRRLQKTRKSSISVATNSNNSNHVQSSRTNIRKDGQQRSSSNDDDNVNNDKTNSHDEVVLNNRRMKPHSLKRREHPLTTTTDDDTTKRSHRYHPLVFLEPNSKEMPSESTGTLLSSIPTPSSQGSSRKAARFQVKTVRKSQQQLLLAAAAKSSNEDDGSVPSEGNRSIFKPSLTGRKNACTPTTDGEHSTTNTDHAINDTVSASKTTENGGVHNRVRFLVSQHKKNESAAEDERLSVPSNALPATVPPSSTTSAQGEVSVVFCTHENFFY